MALYLDIIDRLEDEVDGMINELSATTTSSSTEILDYLVDFLGSLKKNSDGTIKSSVENLKAINTLRPQLSDFISNTNYGISSLSFANKYNELVPIMNDYFSAMALEVGRKELFDQVVNTSIESTIDGLIGKGLDANIGEPLLNIFKNGITSGSDRQSIKKALEEYLITNEKLGKYAGQIGTDAVNQYTSHYLEMVGSDLKLEHFYYKGTKISDTRPLCNKLAGFYFKADQLKAIVQKESQGDGWQGMIPGTNWNNFGVNRGGYRCRHYRLPVSKTIYDNASKKWS